MPEELTLLPCPACGEEAHILYAFERDNKGHVVIGLIAQCTRGCLTTSKHGSRETAAALWNALPRALEWTDEPPKVPGRYWFKTAYRTHIVSVEPDPRKVDDLYICVGSVGNWMSKLHGQWAGPIPEPREPK